MKNWITLAVCILTAFQATTAQAACEPQYEARLQEIEDARMYPGPDYRQIGTQAGAILGTGITLLRGEQNFLIGIGTVIGTVTLGYMAGEVLNRGNDRDERLGAKETELNLILNLLDEAERGGGEHIERWVESDLELPKDTRLVADILQKANHDDVFCRGSTPARLDEIRYWVKAHAKHAM